MSKSLPFSPKLKGEARSWWSVLKETASQWMDDHAMRLSASLALYTILSLAPLLVITTKVVSVIWARNAEQANEQVRRQLSNLMGPQAADAIEQTIARSAQDHNGGTIATILGVAVLLFSATGVFAELQDSMNTIWGVKPKPNMGIMGFVRNRLLSLGMVFGIGFLLLVSMFISTVLTTMAQSVVGQAGWIATILDVIVSVGAITVLFAAIFKFLPDVQLKWRHVWLGAAITAAFFTIGKYGLAIYFKFAAPTSAFGAAGAPVAVLLWIYYSAFILFFGAEFTKVWSLREQSRVVPAECAVKVTEEDRARQGIPSESRMEKALSGKPLNKLPPPRIDCAAEPGRKSPYLLAGGGLVVGAIAGGVGAYLLDKTDGRISRSEETDRLNKRLHKLECRISSALQRKKAADSFVRAKRSGPSWLSRFR